MRFKIAVVLALFFTHLAYGVEDAPNLEAIANQFRSCVGNVSEEAKKEDILVFVSLSMPEQSLKLWSQQVEKIGASLTIRGFVDNSIQATTQRAVKLFSESNNGGFSVDPEKFRQYKINAVPAVVLVSGQDFDVVYGDTSLEAALEHIKNKGSAASKLKAVSYLNKIRHKNG